MTQQYERELQVDKQRHERAPASCSLPRTQNKNIRLGFVFPRAMATALSFQHPPPPKERSDAKTCSAPTPPPCRFCSREGCFRILFLMDFRTSPASVCSCSCSLKIETKHVLHQCVSFGNIYVASMLTEPGSGSVALWPNEATEKIVPHMRSRRTGSTVGSQTPEASENREVSDREWTRSGPSFFLRNSTEQLV